MPSFIVPSAHTVVYIIAVLKYSSTIMLSTHLMRSTKQWKKLFALSQVELPSLCVTASWDGPDGLPVLRTHLLPELGRPSHLDPHSLFHLLQWLYKSNFLYQAKKIWKNIPKDLWYMVLRGIWNMEPVVSQQIFILIFFPFLSRDFLLIFIIWLYRICFLSHFKFFVKWGSEYIK